MFLMRNEPVIGPSQLLANAAIENWIQTFHKDKWRNLNAFPGKTK